MSGNSSSTTCPNCKSEDANLYSDYKPFDYCTVECYECGFTTVVQSFYLTLEDLNERREQVELEPLTVLPEQDEDYVWK